MLVVGDAVLDAYMPRLHVGDGCKAQLTESPLSCTATLSTHAPVNSSTIHRSDWVEKLSFDIRKDRDRGEGGKVHTGQRATCRMTRQI